MTNCRERLQGINSTAGMPEDMARAMRAARGYVGGRGVGRGLKL
jgi:hypothetical protein